MSSSSRPSGPRSGLWPGKSTSMRERPRGSTTGSEGIIGADELHSRFDKADKDTPVPLSEFPQKLREITADLKAYRDNTFTPAYNKVREKKASTTRPMTRPSRKSTESRQGRDDLGSSRPGLQNRNQCNKPSSTKPCDEASSKTKIDEKSSHSRTGRRRSRNGWRTSKIPRCATGRRPRTISPPRPTRRH